MAAEGRHRAVTDVTLAHTDVPAALSPFSYVAPADLVLFLGITVLLLASGVVESRRLGRDAPLGRCTGAPADGGRGAGGDEPVRRRRAVGRAARGRPPDLRRALGRPGRGLPRARHAVARLRRRRRPGQRALAHRGAGDLAGGRPRHRVRHAGRLHVPPRRRGAGGARRRPRRASGVGHGRVRQADLPPCRACRRASRGRGAGSLRRRARAPSPCGPTRGRCTRPGESAGSAGGTSTCGPATAWCCGPGGPGTSCRSLPPPIPSARAGPAVARCSGAARRA